MSTGPRRRKCRSREAQRTRQEALAAAAQAARPQVDLEIADAHDRGIGPERHAGAQRHAPQHGEDTRDQLAQVWQRYSALIVGLAILVTGAWESGETGAALTLRASEYIRRAVRFTPFPGEDRACPSSPKVATYDLQPEMSAAEVTRRTVDRKLGHQAAGLVGGIRHGDAGGCFHRHMAMIGRGVARRHAARGPSMAGAISGGQLTAHLS